MQLLEEVPALLQVTSKLLSRDTHSVRCGAGGTRCCLPVHHLASEVLEVQDGLQRITDTKEKRGKVKT
jgi:hypothetical protein